MQQSRFVVLTGHLNEYPLADLVGILRHQQKSGRLLIDYPNGPAMFYFKEGEFVDAQLGNLNGLQAICVALAQPPSPFNFNPLIPPSRRSIQNSLQKAVSEMLGCWDGSALEIETEPITEESPPQLSGSQLDVDRSLTTSERLALPPAPNVLASRYTATVFAMAAAGLMMLGLSSVIAVTGGFGTSPATAPPLTSPATTTSSLTPNNEEPLASPSVESFRTESKGREVSKVRDVAIADSRKQVQRREDSDTQDSPATPAVAGTSAPEAMEKKPREPSSAVQPVKVVLQIENGRVLRASIANPQAGMDAYEALAIRIARQRRYPSKAAGQETVTINVTQPGQGLQ